jgi:5-methyltetrahydrofolate--homocysteine methyltransferase
VEWGIEAKRGLRYSPGYPAWADMEDQRKIWQLLEPGRIGVSLTEGFAMDPEQSTSAIIFHHPACQYFNAASRA